MAKERVEKQLQGHLLVIFNKVIEEKGLSDKLNPYPVQEEGRADIVIKDASGKGIMLIELKDPTAEDGKSVYNIKVMKREIERAFRMGIRYLGICNFVDAVFYDVRKGEEVDFKTGFAKFREIDKYRESKTLTKRLEEILKNIAKWYVEKCIEIIENRVVIKPIDERFIGKIRSLINRYYLPISERVWELYKSDTAFKRRVQKYFKEQVWSIPDDEEDIEKLVYLSLLILVSKLIFYKALKDSGKYKALPKFGVPPFKSGEELYNYIWEEYFEVLIDVTGDYELLIGEKEDIINELPFKSDAIIGFVEEVVNCEEDYDFSKLNYDIIGRIFEELIREEERHAFGQYFTPSHVVDLINAFCIKEGDEKVLDPSCGSGTFLVRAYDRKKRLKGLRHYELLNDIYGVDISSYATYLSMFNLTIRDLRYPSYPKIIHKDFFDIKVNEEIPFRDFNGNEVVEIFGDFDAIIGNPPYTRQEEIDEINPGEKDKIIKTIENEWRDEKISIPKRSSIYAYFFYHATKFLKDKGYLGFITSNSYLDVDYGKELQRFFLDHFRIIAIIDSKVERFFPSADVNTCITILQREDKKENRDNNLVKFVYLKKKLLEVIDKFGDVDRLRDFIESIKDYYEDDYLKIKVVKQVELYNEDKWGKFLRAPKVYWKILKRGKGKWIKLKDIANVRFGIKTGANEFFYVEDVTDKITDNDIIAIRNKGNIESVEDIKNNRLRVVKNKNGELWLIEEEFLKPIVKSPREIKKYVVDEKDLKYKVLFIPKFKDNVEELEKELKAKYPYVWEYIKDGEKKEYHTKPTCKGRKPWYCLGNEIIGDIVMNERIGEKCAFYWNKKININKNLYAIYIKQEEYKKIVWGLLNSTIIRLFIETGVRSLTGAITAIDIDVYIAENINIPNPKNIKNPNEIINAMEKLKDNVVLSIFKELNANTPKEVDLNKVNPDRLALDKAVLKAIGFKDEEIDDILVELYKSVIDLVKSRLEKAKSVENVKKKKEKLNIEIYLEEIDERIKEMNIKVENTSKFANKLKGIIRELTPMKKLQNKLLNEYWKRTFKEPYDENKFQMKLDAFF